MFTVTDYSAPDGMRISLAAMPGEGRPLRRDTRVAPPAARDLQGPILEHLRQCGDRARVRGIADALGFTAPETRAALRKLQRKGLARMGHSGRDTWWGLAPGAAREDGQ